MVKNWINQKSGAIAAAASGTSRLNAEVVSQITKIAHQIINPKSIMEERTMEKLHSHVTTVTSKVIEPQIVERKREI